jgi:hypothetical protein
MVLSRMGSAFVGKGSGEIGMWRGFLDEKRLSEPLTFLT